MIINSGCRDTLMAFLQRELSNRGASPMASNRGASLMAFPSAIGTFLDPCLASSNHYRRQKSIMVVKKTPWTSKKVLWTSAHKAARCAVLDPRVSLRAESKADQQHHRPKRLELAILTTGLNNMCLKTHVYEHYEPISMNTCTCLNTHAHKLMSSSWAHV